jgi:hypothetical protein
VAHKTIRQLSLYLITCRRVTEGWKTIGEAIRAAEGLG